MTLGNLTVIGIGRLGLCVALCFERAGYNVLGVDLQQDYVQSINTRTFRSAEPNVNEYLSTSVNFRGTTSLTEGINFSDYLFLLVQTPNGGCDKYYDHSILGGLLQKLNAQRLKGKHIIICCTVMPGYISSIGRSLLTDCVECTLNYNPEFIAQGAIIQGFSSPDIVLIGEATPEIGAQLEEIYKKVCINIPQICRMNVTDAEITKIGLNGYICTKIAYCNMIGELCDSLGADKLVVARAIGSDSRVGTKYFTPGHSYGGPCFPRDTRALAKCITDAGLSASIPLATDSQNISHVQYEVEVLLATGVRSFIFTDLCYKEDSKIPIIEESAKIKIAQVLVKRGCKVILRDTREIINEVKKEYGDIFEYNILNEPRTHE